MCSGPPKVPGCVREGSEHPLQRSFVNIASQSSCDIPYGGFRREVVLGSHRLHFFRHHGTIFEWPPGFVHIPVRHKQSARPNWEYAQEPDCLFQSKAATKRLEHAFTIV
jgi:hypothetical protein